MPSNNGDQCHEEFINSVNSNGLTQCVMEPTRQQRTLDLILTTDPMKITSLNVTSPFTTSCDHNSITFELYVPASAHKKSNKTVKYNFRKANFEAICNYLSKIDWLALLRSCCQNTEKYWNEICVVLDNCVKLFVPSYPAGIRKQTCPKNVRRLRCIKRRKYRNMKSTPTIETKASYKTASTNYEHAVKESNLKSEKDLLNEPSLKKFYSFVNSKLKSQPCIPSLLSTDDVHITDDHQKATLMNEYFSSVFTTDDGKTPYFAKQVNDSQSLNFVEFSYVEVIKAIKTLQSKTSRTPDGYPAFFIKGIANEIAIPFSLLFELSMTTGQLPLVWKSAIVAPIFKKGPSSRKENYRPISLTCIACKVMEKVISKEILKHLQKYKLISNAQFGFLPHRSTCTQLISFLSRWLKCINDKLRIDNIYIDFQKAFDTVSHQKLLIKLEAYGIRYELLQWISDFLIDRTQCVSVGNSTSTSINVPSGVPQGSVLGPLLFIIYINDISSCLEPGCDMKLFADDVKVSSSRSEYHDNNNDPLSFTLQNLVTWCKTWQMRISLEKSYVFSFGNRNIQYKEYYVDKSQLNSVVKVKDLGINLTENLKFTTNCANLSAKASSMCYLVKRIFTSRNKDLLLRAYKFM